MPQREAEYTTKSAEELRTPGVVVESRQCGLRTLRLRSRDRHGGGTRGDGVGRLSRPFFLGFVKLVAKLANASAEPLADVADT
jgi:hypothetical protein